MTPAGVLTTLVEFTGNSAINTGAEPLTGLVAGSDGNLYGTTSSGGVLKDIFGLFPNHGTIFKMTSAGVLSTLVEFTGSSGDHKGRLPYGDLVEASDGNFYGTTRFGGTSFIGTAFKMTPFGVLTTLVEFTGNGATNRGSGPISGLVQFSNGNFYGTTSTGGVSSHGTVFTMTPAGELNTLVDFTNDEASNKGSLPYGGLVQASDGNFYGTTAKGGAIGRGTVFKLTPAGGVSTVFDFAADPQDAFPTGTLVVASDGNLYGTASGYDPGDVSPSNPGGGIFRLIFTGRPSIYPLDAEPRLDGSVVVQGKFNARRAVTVVTLEYGTDGVVFPNNVMLSVSLNGDQTTLLGTPLTGLQPGVPYFYRFRATNSFGETVSSIASFTRLEAPTAVATPVSDLEPRTARFNGLVNAQNYDASVVFEYGTDGNTFPNQVRDVVPATVTGAEDVLVSARPEEQLSEGTTYHYRLVATNAGGTTVSGVTSFRTLEKSVLTLGRALALSTTTARVNGLVNPRGSDTEVDFEYGTNGVTFPNSVDALPAVVPGGAGETPVSAMLPNLLQGTTYYYRIRGTSAGGPSESEVGTFALDVLSGFDQRPPDVPPQAQGFILVNLEPMALLTAPGVKPAWRFVGEQEWRTPGVPVGGLTSGDRQIEFRPVPGYLQPLRELVTITSGEPAVVVEKEYFEAASGGVTGSITVTLKPDDLAESDPGDPNFKPQPQRAQWRLLGEGDPTAPDDAASTTWRDSATTYSGLVPGAYLIELKPVTGRTTPTPLVVNVTTRIEDVNGVQTEVADARNVSATYFAAEATGGTFPGVLPFETVAGNSALPYAHVGQIRSDLGVATGFVIKAQPTRNPELGARVVLTAAHVVFDDAELTAAPIGTPTEPPADLSGFATAGLQWLHQRDRGSFEPLPEAPRGFYVLAGYAAKRIIERTPGEASPESQTLDVAALYFMKDVGRGGFAGFLASDAADNEWLVSDALKTLVGYPTGEEVLPANRGRMHATAPANVGFSRVHGRTFATSGIRSSGGNSGGPLCVQFEGGLYYPAAIFLGGTGQSVVRAIDSDVIDLFERAEISGNGGEHNTNGGVPRLDAPEGVGTFEAASLRVNLGPAAAVSRGAKWKLGATGRERADNVTVTSLAPGNYTVRFTDVNGFITPNPVGVTLHGGKTEPLERIYDGITGQPDDRTVNAFTPATFTVEVSGTPQSYQWATQRQGHYGGDFENLKTPGCDRVR